MTKKKVLGLIIMVIAVAGLAWWAIDLKANANRSDSELISFAIEDTAAVDRIIIKEPNGWSIELIRGENEWTDKNGNCIIQSHIQSILIAAKKIEFKGYVTENSKEQHLTMISAQGKEVQFYKDGEWHKTWYIGTSTQDHYGQVMLLDSDEAGKSDLPVLMKIKGFNGFLSPRFFADLRKWQCTQIFALPVNEIAQIDYTNFIDAGRSFTIKRNGFQFEVKQNGDQLSDLDTTSVFRYLNKYKKIHFDIPNYVLTPNQVDSVKQSQPFASLKVKEVSGETTTLRCFRIQGEEVFDNEFGEVVNHDINRFWCELPNGELVKCQYFVFDPLFRGDLYFKFDKSKYEKKHA